MVWKKSIKNFGKNISLKSLHLKVHIIMNIQWSNFKNEHQQVHHLFLPALSHHLCFCWWWWPLQDWRCRCLWPHHGWHPGHHKRMVLVFWLFFLLLSAEWLCQDGGVLSWRKVYLGWLGGSSHLHHSPNDNCHLHHVLTQLLLAFGLVQVFMWLLWEKEQEKSSSW